MVVFIYIGGYHLVILLHQTAIKNEMKTYLKANKNNQIGSSFVFDLVNNEIQDPHFSWEDNKAEFIYNHEWYDVIDISYKDQKIIVYALKDGQENELEKQLEKIRPTNKSNARSIQHTIKFSCFEVHQLTLSIQTISSFKEYNCFKQIALLNGLPRINIPPPKNAHLSI